MLLRLALCALAGACAAAGAGDPLLDELAARGGGALAVCLARHDLCGAALWRDGWAAARASCVAGRALAPVRVLRASHPRVCDVHPGDAPWRRAVLVRLHPYWRGGWDVALLRLDAPLAPLRAAAAPRGNRSAELGRYEYWMERVAAERREAEMRPGSLAEDARLLLLAVLLPGAAFAAFFLLVTFCTGAVVKVPYSNVSEPGLETLWIPYPHKNTRNSKGAKCYPTYGQV